MTVASNTSFWTPIGESVRISWEAWFIFQRAKLIILWKFKMDLPIEVLLRESST
jgi:hypothetical protein